MASPLAMFERQAVAASDGTSLLFNAAIAASAVSAALELGLLDRVQRDGVVSIPQFCSEHDLHVASVTSVARALACFEIVTMAADQAVIGPGPLFANAFQEKSYFLWLVRGYGHMWQNLADLCRNRGRPAHDDARSFVRRDGRSIALAGREYGARFVDRHFEAALDTCRFTTAADLGCGSAARLMALARARPQFRGVGIEVNREAAEAARAAVDGEGLSDRVTIVEADVRVLEPCASFAAVDVLFCFFMGHDLWPRPHCTTVMRNLRVVFPSAHRFLMCDTYRSDAAPSPFLPTFQLGFEWTHAVMGQYIPTREEWQDVFHDSAWECVRCYPVDIPASAIFDLRPRPIASAPSSGPRSADGMA